MKKSLCLRTPPIPSASEGKRDFTVEVVYADKSQSQGFGLLPDLILEEIMRSREESQKGKCR
jgi:hypothetical protein